MKTPRFKLALINPPNIRPDIFRDNYGYANKSKTVKWFLPPLGISNLAGYLRKRGINVLLDDMNIKIRRDHKKFDNNYLKQISLVLLNRKRVCNYILNNYDDKELDRISEEFVTYLLDSNVLNSDLIGFSLEREFYSLSPFLIIAKKIKEISSAKIIIGGFEPGDFPIEILNFSFIDYGIIEDGEIPLFKLIQAICNNHSFEKVPNLVYKHNSRIIISKFHFTPPKKLVTPDFDGLPLDLYHPNNDNKLKSKILVLPFQFIRGCVRNCPFCKESFHNGLKLYDPTDVVNSIEFLKNKYSTKYFMFLNNEINPSKDYALSISTQIIKKKLDIIWSDCILFNKADKNLIYQLKKSGAKRLIWGIETGSFKLLNYIEKQLRIPDAIELLKYSQSKGIWNGLEIIAGLPYEGEKDVHDTIAFLSDTQKYVNTVYLNHFKLNRGSKFFKNSSSYNLKIYENSNIQNIFYYDEYTGLPFDEINGKKWHKKKLQINSSFKMIKKVILPNQLFCTYMDILLNSNRID